MLATKPMDVDEAKFARRGATLDVNDKFVITKSSFERQYAQLYFLRLTKMRAAAQARAQKVWPSSEGVLHVNSIRDIPGDRECVLAGTLFKEMKNRPNILDEYDKAKALAVKARTTYTAAEDSLILEDDTGRIRLANPPECTVIDVQNLVSGPVIAVRGQVSATGVFVVSACCFVDVPPQAPLPTPAASSSSSSSSSPAASRYLCLVSGLRIGDAHVDPLPRQMFADFVSGFLGAAADHECAASIVQLIVAGNVLAAFDNEIDRTAAAGAGAAAIAAASAEGAKAKRDQAAAKAARPLAECDAVLSQLCASTPVLLMPGDSDPANYTMPQQPLHVCMFARAATHSTFRSTTNPCDVHVDGVHVIGTSGQNVADMAKHCTTTDPMQLLENTLRWAHLAPTAPDTLPCYPLNEEEPFVLTHAPHVYFVGNQDAFATRLVHGPDGQRVRLVCVPAFAATAQAVLVNLDTLECESVQFAVPASV